MPATDIRVPFWQVQIQLVRSLSAFLGLFALLNIASALVTPAFDRNIWWIDFRPLPFMLQLGILGPLAMLLLAFGVTPAASRLRRRLTLLLLLLTLGFSVANGVVFYVLAARGAIDPGFPLPFSLWVCLALGILLIAMLRIRTPSWNTRRDWRVFAAGLVFWSLAFPLAQIFCFGKTDYRRPADAVVVFGARAYADGRPSDALADRVRTACGLYHQGLAGTLIFSGGPGDGAIHETESMRRLAVSLGVRDQDIVADVNGLDTRSTVRNTLAIAEGLGARRILAVSHYYHLPRVKLSYQREGVEVFTVLARERYTLRKMPYLVAREVAAIWAYYLRALV